MSGTRRRNQQMTGGCCGMVGGGWNLFRGKCVANCDITRAEHNTMLIESLESMKRLIDEEIRGLKLEMTHDGASVVDTVEYVGEDQKPIKMNAIRRRYLRDFMVRLGHKLAL